jgi:hypothetical protein
MKKNIIIVVIAFIIGLILALLLANVVLADTVIYVNPGSIGSHGCDDSEWHFVITQISDPALAPSSIHVVWGNGSEDDLPLDRVTGGTAHYYYYDNLNSPVVNAWTNIYDGWSGTFNLSHGPCFSNPTPTYTLPPTSTSTSTSTSTPENTPTNTSTNTPENTPTSTPVTYTPTPTVTNDPRTPTPTNTEIPTLTPTLVPTETPIFTPTNTPFITLTPTSVFTPTPISTIVETPVFTETPYPPKPAEANIMAKPYPGTKMGQLVMGGENYNLYLGRNAEDGSLLLPEAEKGAALYLHTIWVHRAWNSGWLDIRVGDTIYFYSAEGNKEVYEVISTKIIDYGIYPKVNNKGDKFQYIATCYSSDNKMWTDVMLFYLEKIDGREAK